MGIDTLISVSDWWDVTVWYTKVHFREEEMKMVEKGYPYLEEHRKEHADLEAKVKSFQKDLTSGKDSININYQSYLNSQCDKGVTGV